MLLGMVVLLLAALALPIAAQDQPLGPGEGAPIVWPNFGGDPTNFNPLLINDASSQDVAVYLWPGFVGLDPQTGEIIPHAPFTIVDNWTVSDDGTTYTFKLRDDYKWTARP
jgi:ABC-type transport system substrate-binding protein